ncbi:MAG: hypothetical protein FGM57_00950 [Candidatus Taylorbacteria bacterium]|nr:hypothetical protein [Candidatus Taylorbacteria bacterium]
MKKIVPVYKKVRSKLHSFMTTSTYAPFVEGTIFFFSGVGAVFVFVLLAMQIGIFNVRGSISERNTFFTEYSLDEKAAQEAVQHISKAGEVGIAKERVKLFPQVDFSWLYTSEWETLKGALYKDREVIRKAAYEVGISPRVLVSVVIAEQLRFFTSDRESFKKFFEPLKILGTLSQFSLGVSGIKPETAELIEKNLQDESSSRYISDPQIKNILNLSQTEIEKYGSSDISRARFDRLTDSKNHYYSYLYTALFIKQIETEWKKAGFDISNRPEILATLFNLGFDKSVPKADPKVAGSQIVLDGKTYTFGELAFAFYYSGDLSSVFGY